MALLAVNSALQTQPDVEIKALKAQMVRITRAVMKDLNEWTGTTCVDGMDFCGRGMDRTFPTVHLRQRMSRIVHHRLIWTVWTFVDGKWTGRFLLSTSVYKVHIVQGENGLKVRS